MKATEVTAGLAESNGSLLPGIWRDSLHVTCGLTACTPGSAPGPTLGNEYGKTLPFLLKYNPQIWQQHQYDSHKLPVLSLLYLHKHDKVAVGKFITHKDHRVVFVGGPNTRPTNPR